MGSSWSKPTQGEQTRTPGRQERRRRTSTASNASGGSNDSRNSNKQETRAVDSGARAEVGAQGGLGLEEGDEVIDAPTIVKARMVFDVIRRPLKTRIVVNGAELNAELTRARDVDPEMIPEDARDAAVKREMGGILEANGVVGQEPKSTEEPNSTEGYDKEAMKKMIKAAILQYHENRIERIHRRGQRNVADNSTGFVDFNDAFLFSPENSFPKNMEEMVSKLEDSNQFKNDGGELSTVLELQIRIFVEKNLLGI